MHPWLASTVTAFDILAGVMDGLLRYTAEGRLGPALAEGFSISDDGLTYTFALRQDVRFHNEELFSGEDFIAAGLSPGTRVQCAEHARVAEDRERRSSGRSDARDYHHRAVRPLPVDRGHDLPLPRRPWRRASPPSARSSPAPRSARGRSVSPAGSRAAGVSLARWDDYWGEPAHLERIDYRVQPDVDALLAALAAAEIDLAGAQERSRPLASTRR